jgi:hypothetical protein
VVNSIIGIIIFQFGMFVISGSVLSKRINIYLFAFLVIQSMVVFTVFEFIRKPWDGKELEIEKALQQQANNLFESISSYNTETAGDFMPSNNLTNNDQQEGDGGKLPGKKEKKEDKLEVLMRAYENPLEVYFVENNQDQDDEFQGVDETLVGVNSPRESSHLNSTRHIL